MAILSPELLADLHELPRSALLVLAGSGAMLWLVGWLTHRFWMVLASTLAGGLIGLRYGPEYGLQAIVAGLLAAVAFGCLALSVVRMAVFLGCGVGLWQLARVFVPEWSAAPVCILVGGLAGILCFRLCVILVSSSLGTLLLGYSGLILAEPILKFDSVRWAAENPNLAAVGLAGGVLFGFLFQYVIERARRRRRIRREAYFGYDAGRLEERTWLRRAS